MIAKALLFATAAILAACLLAAPLVRDLIAWIMGVL